MTIRQAIVSPGCGCDRRDMLQSLSGIDEALGRIATYATPVVRTEAVSTGSAVGRVLAQPVRSRPIAPSFDNAAMDGYAIATSALTGQKATTSVAGAMAARSPGLTRPRIRPVSDCLPRRMG